MKITLTEITSKHIRLFYLTVSVLYFSIGNILNGNLFPFIANPSNTLFNTIGRISSLGSKLNIDFTLFLNYGWIIFSIIIGLLLIRKNNEIKKGLVSSLGVTILIFIIYGVLFFLIIPIFE